MREYIKGVTKTNELLLGGKIHEDEINRLSKSDYRWADNRQKTFQTRTVKKGEIYQFEFGKNFIPEMSYEHRGLVVGVNKKLLYVLPIFSYIPQRHADVFHPIDNPQSKSDLYLLKKSEYAFIQHDSVLKLNDIRTVSVNRILYFQKDGRFDIKSDAFIFIENLVLKKYFPEFAYEYNKKKEEMIALEQENEQLRKEIELLQSQAKEQKDE